MMCYKPLCLVAVLPLVALFLHGQQATVEGVVVNSQTGDPVPNTRVKLQIIGAPTVYTATDSRGRFRFMPAGTGPYSLSVDRPGLTPVTVSVGPRGRSSANKKSTRQAKAPARTAPSDFTTTVDAEGSIHVRIAVTPGAIITGFVTDPNGLPPVQGVSIVEVYTRRTLPNGDSRLETVGREMGDDRGEYRTAPLEPGTYYLAVQYGMQPRFWDRSWHTTYYPRALDLDSAAPIELAPGQEFRADLQIMRVTGVRLAGRLNSPATGSDSRSGYSVSLHGEGIPSSGYVSGTSSGDMYEFTSVVPGKYTFGAETYSGSPRFGVFRRIEIGDHDITRFDLDLIPLNDLSGAVIFAEGCEPLPLRIFLFTPGRQTEALTGPNGEFVITDMHPGNWIVGVSPQPITGRVVTVSSMRLGVRDVLKDGLEYPFPGDERLRITMTCTNRRPQ